MKIASLMISCIVIMLQVSCGTVQTYEGPEQTTENVATIQASSRSMLDQVIGIYDQATVHAVDGVKSGAGQIHAEVLPGQHTITIRLDKVSSPML